MKYNTKFFESQSEGSYQSAKIINKIIIEKLHPKSVVDIGCGVGTFLRSFKELGVRDILGLDGPWIKKEMLQIPKEDFIEKDLSKPFSLDKKYDLAISLEVAEHLTKESAEGFVKSLCSISDFVVFSAATKGQDGHFHCNEQFLDYWADLFAKQGYVAIDNIRPQIWNNPSVEFWYSQNIILFVKKERLEDNPELLYDYNRTNQNMLSVIHPHLHLANVNRINRIKKFLPIGLLNKFKRFLK